MSLLSAAVWVTALFFPPADDPVHHQEGLVFVCVVTTLAWMGQAAGWATAPSPFLPLRVDASAPPAIPLRPPTARADGREDFGSDYERDAVSTSCGCTRP